MLLATCQRLAAIAALSAVAQLCALQLQVCELLQPVQSIQIWYRCHCKECSGMTADMYILFFVIVTCSMCTLYTCMACRPSCIRTACKECSGSMCEAAIRQHCEWACLHRAPLFCHSVLDSCPTNECM
jgi:hypothetical protein